MAYIRAENYNRLRVDYRITGTAIEDAIHAYMDEDELARLIGALLRDPTAGRRSGEGYVYTSGGLAAQYRLHQAAEDLMVVYILRIKPSPGRAERLEAGARKVRDFAIEVLKYKIKSL